MKQTNIKGWRGALSGRVSEREAQRQVMYNDARKFVVGYIPELLREYFRIIVGGLIAFWLIAELLLVVFHAQPFYTYAALGLLYAMQSTYYKYRLFKDPDYKIPKCRCNSRPNENMALVLKSKNSTVLRIPTSVLAILLYILLLGMYYFGYWNAVVTIAAAALCVSIYMSYVMLARIGSLCSICVNMTALNALILLRILFN